MNALEEDQSLTPAFLCNLFTEEIYLIEDKNEVLVETEKKEEFIPEPVEIESVQTTLVEEKPIEYIQKKPKDATIDFIGGYQKKLAILVTDMEEVLNNGNEKSFLGNVLAAIKMNFNDVAIINLTKRPDISLDQLFSDLDPKTVMGFSLPEEFTKDYQLNVPFYYSDSIVVFYPCSLKDISKNTGLKKILWGHLQGIFKV